MAQSIANITATFMEAIAELSPGVVTSSPPLASSDWQRHSTVAPQLVRKQWKELVRDDKRCKIEHTVDAYSIITLGGHDLSLALIAAGVLLH